MKVVLLGATGMVGQGVLRECLVDPGVDEVLALGRSSTGKPHAKLRELQHSDLMNLAPIENQLAGYDACFYCLGVSSAGKTEEEYSRVTYEYTVAVAAALLRKNPSITFVFISGSGADSSEKGRTMWARVKGRAENALFAMPFRAAYALRPAYIIPKHGVTSRTAWYRWVYAVMKPFDPLWKLLFPSMVTTTENVGRAMLILVRSGYGAKILESRDIELVCARAGGDGAVSAA